jgi:hypothetical protein
MDSLSAEARFRLTEPSAAIIGNSSFPYGFNDGPVWAGKGLTLAVAGGVQREHDHLTAMLNPIVFVAENSDFVIPDISKTEGGRYSDPFRFDAIDQPQRFGAKSYTRLDPGESEVALRGFGVRGGLSSRSQIWGPAYEHPLILGNNAGGVPRLFLGTEAPVDARWVTLQGQMIWGQLNESGYGPDTGALRRHFLTAAVGTLGVKRLPGLELGVARVFHTSWPQNGWQHVPWLLLVQDLFNDAPAVGELSDNQLASAFIRIAPPGKGFEIYGEFGREDRGDNLRNVVLSLDHDAGYLVGFARGWASEDRTRIHVLRGELLDTRMSPFQQVLGETPWYMHVSQSQGHTNRGQMLASVGGFGGGGSNVAFDRYTPSGRTTVRWDRIMRATPRDASGVAAARQADLTHALGLERAVFTAHGQLTVGTTLVGEFNRYFSGDAMNANVSVSYRLVR